MLKDEKVKLLGGLVKEIQGKSLVLVDYEGIDMPGIHAVRSGTREAGGRLKVIKNTLLKRMMERAVDAKLYESLPDDFFSGMTAIGYFDEENFSASGKVLLNAEKKKAVKIKGGLHEGALLSAGEVRALASIPSKDELYGFLVGALSSIVGKLVVVLDEVSVKKEEKK